MQAYETYTIERAGMTFQVEYHYDQDSREPWKECDGRGIVSDWTTRDKRPGERVMVSEHGSKRYFDFAETLRIAKRDGWGPQLEGKTKAESAVAAVEREFEFLKGWCTDEWHWAGVVVTLLDTQGNETSETDALWSIESNATEYLQATALELSDEIIHRVPADGVLKVAVKS